MGAAPGLHAGMRRHTLHIQAATELAVQTTPATHGCHKRRATTPSGAVIDQSETAQAFSVMHMLPRAVGHSLVHIKM